MRIIDWHSVWKRTIIGFLIFVAIVSIVYVAMDRENVVLDAAARKRFGGAYLQGPLGTTHYQLLGEADEPVVVMLHGASIGLWDFDLQIGALRNAGFRVLRFDSLGRGLSDRPNFAYTRSVYVSQLEQLLERLSIDGPVFLMGHSLGGATATEFAAGSPERVHAMALISPVVNPVNMKMPLFICNTPVIGDFLLRTGMISALHSRANAQWRHSSVDVAKYDRLFQRAISIEGYEHAACSMFRTSAMGDYRDSYKAVGEHNIPGLMVYGGEDETVLRKDVDDLKKVLPSFRFHLYPEAEHSAHIRYKDAVNRELIKFFKSHLPSGD